MRWFALCAFLMVACAGEPARLVSLTALGDTRDSLGPYVVQAELRGDLGDDELLLCWSVDAGASFQGEKMSARPGRSDLRFAAIPGQPAGTMVSFQVVLVASGSACPAAGAELLSFRILVQALGCEVDSDCRLGVEICDQATCREFSGTCESGACPGGYTCDAARFPPTCVIPARTCTSHGECPVLEECDFDRGECVARPACSESRPCAEGRACDPVSGFCAMS